MTKVTVTLRTLEALCAPGIHQQSYTGQEYSHMGNLVIADLQTKDDLQPEQMQEIIGGTAPTHHVDVHDIRFTRPIDQSSPNLFFA